MSRFEGQTAVVTGAARGIGLAIARGLADDGARVVVVDRDRVTLAQEFAKDPRFELVVADVADHRKVVAKVGKFAPRLIVNNVGVSAERGLWDVSEDEIRSTFETNVLGPWLFTRRLMELHRDRGTPASVLFVLSLHATAVRLSPDYSTSKAALSMLVKEMAVVGAPYGIRVNGIEPGAIDTWSHRVAISPEELARDAARIPLGRHGRPADLVGLSLALLDDATSGYVTGTTVQVDGGLQLFNWITDAR